MSHQNTEYACLIFPDALLHTSKEQRYSQIENASVISFQQILKDDRYFIQ